MSDQITKESAVASAGSVAALAQLLGITVQAIYMWPDNAPIPMARQWQLRALRPETFAAGATAPQSAELGKAA